MVCSTSKGSDQPAHTHSLIRAFASCINSMTIKLLTEHHLEILSLKGGCTGLSESTLVKMTHCWKSHVAAHFFFGGGGDFVIRNFQSLTVCKFQLHAVLIHSNVQHPIFQEISKGNYLTPDQLTMEK